MAESLLEINELKKHFPVKKGLFSRNIKWVKAVDGINLDIKKGDILGLVGESGCGKTTLVNTILRLEEPTAGSVFFEDQDIFNLKYEDLRRLRKKMQIVFQDPFWSLNPRHLIKDIVGEPLKVHLNLTNKELITKVKELLRMVGLSEDGAYKYPHEFSGGQRQRIAIARALALEPELIILDEPTSSIDILSQAQILELLKNIKNEFELTYILISHDLSVVRYMADKIAVMYLGKIIEYGTRDDIFSEPAHPYTKALLSSIPDLNTEDLAAITVLEGTVPSAINPPSGCSFHTRCQQAVERCKQEEPKILKVNENHYTSCFMLEN